MTINVRLEDCDVNKAREARVPVFLTFVEDEELALKLEVYDPHVH